MTKQYIGDGVYVEIANGMLKLTTDRVAGSAYTDGPDTIFLEKPATKLIASLRAIKFAALNGKDAQKTLAHIVRLCIDAGVKD